MKVFNLTDVETPKLAQHKLVGHTFALGKALLAPGAMVKIDSTEFARMRTEIQHLVVLGALSVGELPPAYVLAKQKAAPPPAPTPEPEPEPAPPAPQEPATFSGRKRPTGA